MSVGMNGSKFSGGTNAASCVSSSCIHSRPCFDFAMHLIFLLRNTIYTLILLGVAFFAVVIAFVSTLLGERLNTNYYVARTFWYIAGSIMGWKFDVEGEEHLWRLGEGGEVGAEGDAGKEGRSAVLIGNHQR